MLYLFAGRFKNVPPLHGFPIDLTLLFLAATCGLLLWAIAAGRVRFAPPSLPVLATALFSGLALESFVWSSMEPLNVDKLVRFLLLTGTSFFASCLLAKERSRRVRLLHLVVWFSVILVYYMYYRWSVGGDPLSDPSTPSKRLNGDNYLEYADHAYMLFVLALSLGVFGSPKQSWIAALGSGMALSALLTIGGRGSLFFALLAIRSSAAGLLARSQRGRVPLRRLASLIAVIGASAAVGYAGLAQLRGPDSVSEQLHTLHRYEAQLSGEETRSSDLHIEGPEDAFAKWLQNPIIGWGIGEFLLQHTEFAYPHDLLLEILTEMGLVGVFLFCAAAAVAAIVSGRLLWSTAGWVDASIALLFLTSLLSHLTVSRYLADVRIFFMYLGLAIGTAVDAAPRGVRHIGARGTSLTGPRARRPAEGLRRSAP